MAVEVEVATVAEEGADSEGEIEAVEDSVVVVVTEAEAAGVAVVVVAEVVIYQKYWKMCVVVHVRRLLYVVPLSLRVWSRR